MYLDLRRVEKNYKKPRKITTKATAFLAVKAALTWENSAQLSPL